MEKSAIHAQKDERVYLGFWIYLMTDLLMFAVLFAVYAVLRDSTFGAMTIKDILNPWFVMGETLILLTSSFVSGLAVCFARQGERNKAVTLLAVTVLLGVAFLAMEVSEFSHLIHTGNSFTRSAFLSAFFALVGFHGLHITAGTVWLSIMMVQIVRKGLTGSIVRKTSLAGIFWHFLDLVWIFIFTIVYLFGGLL